MKKILTLTLLALSCIFITGCQTNNTEDKDTSEYNVTITDDYNNAVNITKKPTNVVITGLPPMTSFFLQVVGDDVLAGRPTGSLNDAVFLESIYPNYKDIVEVGYAGNYSVETVLNLEPDLIICGMVDEKYNTMKETGVPTIGLSWGDDIIKESSEWVTMLGEIFELEEKAATIVESNTRLNNLVETKLASVSKTKTGLMLPDYNESYIEISNDIYAGGYWLNKIKVNNVAADAEGWMGNMETIYTWDPEIVFLSSFSNYNASDLLNDKATEGHLWSQLKAGQTGDIYKYPTGLFNWYAISPEASISLLWLASNAHPELFSDINIKTEVANHYANFGITLTTEQLNNLIDQK